MLYTVEKVTGGCFPIEAFMMHEMLNNELHFKVIGMKKIEIKEGTANKKNSRVYF